MLKRLTHLNQEERQRTGRRIFDRVAAGDDTGINRTSHYDREV